MDLGCGSGQASCDLAALFSRVVGIDASAEQLAHADRSKPNVEYRCGPVERTGLPPQCAEMVAAATALHWCAAWRRRTVMPAMHLLCCRYSGCSQPLACMPPRRFDLPAVYREARRILKPGGALVAWTYTVRCCTATGS